MTQPTTLGPFEQLVLTAILALSDNAYGVTIHDRVGDFAAPKRVSLGAVYATLDRLEDKGLIASRLSDPTPERGGRSKRLYELRPTGERALRESALVSKRVCDRIEDIWGATIWNPSRAWKPVRQ
jgi:PadR family transcriptional regulator PadR